MTGAPLDAGRVAPPAERVGRSAAGREGYDPVMLLGVLTYAYLVGTLSSRAIERACHTDVAFRVACAQDVPDHSTISRFRQDHQDALAGLFEQVLLLCAKAGLGQFATIAIDGTKIAANASLGKNRKRSWLRAQVQQMLAEADAVDAAEDRAELDDTDKQDPTSPGWTDPTKRRQLIEQALAEVNAKEDASDAHARQARVTRAQARVVKDLGRINTVRTELQAKTAAFDQRRTARLAAGGTWRWKRVPVEDNFALKAALAQLQNSRERLDQAESATRATAKDDPVGNITDPQSRKIRSPHGYIQGYNAQLAVAGDGLIVAVQLTQTSPDTAHFVPMMNAAVTAIDLIRDHTGRADAVIGTVLADAGYISTTNITAPGPDRLIAVGNSRDIQHDADTAGPTGRSPHSLTPVGLMAVKVAANQDTYNRRGATVEPVNAHLKDRRNLRRFTRRGLAATSSELHIAAWVTNLAKLFNHLNHAPQTT